MRVEGMPMAGFIRFLGIAAVCGCLFAQAQGVEPNASGTTRAQPVTVSVDLDRRVGDLEPIYNWFGYDEANYTTMRDGKRLLRELHDLSPCRSISARITC